MKTKEELDALKKEVEALDEKLQELTEEELEQVTGGVGAGVCVSHIVTDVELGSESIK